MKNRCEITISVISTIVSALVLITLSACGPAGNGGGNGVGGNGEPGTGPVDKLLNKMEFGVIAFNAPTHINIEDSSQIQLLLSLGDKVEELKQLITEAGEKVGDKIKVADIMEARLSGYMFQITLITPETQAVSESKVTEWKWEIHPKEAGKHKLHLTLTALLDFNGHSTQRVIRTFDRYIEVTITTTQELKQFITSNWQWLWAVFLVPLIGWLWKRKKAANKANQVGK